MLTAYLFGILPALHPSYPPAALAHALPIREIPRPQGPTLTCSSGSWPLVPRRSNRSQLSMGVERERAERLGSQETLIQGLGAAKISHGTLDKLVSLFGASVS